MASGKSSLSKSPKRLCTAHGGDAMEKPVFCNKFQSAHLPEQSEIKLHLPQLIVYTVPQETHQCHVILKESKLPPNISSNTLGPFSVKQDQSIEEVYSCSISADGKHIILSLSLTPKANQMVSMKSHDFCLAIYETRSNIGAQRIMLEPGTFTTAVFHLSKKNIFYAMSYNMDEVPIIQTRSLNSLSVKEKRLDIVDPDCENLFTLSCNSEFLILQVIVGDMSPPYCNTDLFVLSQDTLEVIKKIPNPAIVAPCHSACTLNYVPDHSFQEGYIKGTFPKTMKTKLDKVSQKGTATAKLPVVQVHSLRRLARNTITYHVTCDRCTSELQLPEILQSYLL